MSDIEEKCKFALQALNDWAVTYAPDMCSDETVALAKARIHEHGTLAYIANATDQLHAAIQLLSEAEKRERDAREALEEIAAVEPRSNCDAGSMARSRMRDIARIYIRRNPK